MNGRNAWIKCLTLALCLCTLLSAPRTRAEQGNGKGADITKKCAFKVSEGNKGKMLDGNAGSIWSYKHKGAYVGIKLPKDVEAGWLRVEWLFDPKAYELIEYDADMNVLRQRTQADMFPNIYSMYELLPGTKFIQLKLTAKDQSICRIGVYSSGELPADVQLWNPPVDKADLMVVSAHQDDEIIFLGGTIPYYAVALKKPTVVVYMANCARYRRAEALNALWKMGVRDYPDFINLPDEKVGSIEAGIKLWGGKDNILSLVVERIRRYKPEVIVTQDLNGEYGHNQHKITARCMKYAIDAAADPSQYPESAEKYGAWQVKKLYHHLYKENAMVMDWETPLEALGGKTALEVAKIGMKEHSSQTGAYAVKSHGTYDNSKFGLYFTTVGEDEAKNDFFEHIDPDASAAYLATHAAEIEGQKAAAAAELAAAAQTAEAEPDDAEGEDTGETGEEAPSEDGTGEGDMPSDDATEASEGDMAEEAFNAGEDEADQAPEETEDDAEGAEAETPETETPEEETPTEDLPDPTPGESDDIVAGQEGVQAAGQLLVASETANADNPPQTAAGPVAVRENGGSPLLLIALIGVGVAVVGAAGWFGWRSMQGRRRHRRRRR